MLNINQITQLFLKNFPEYLPAFEVHVEFNECFLPHIFYSDVISKHLLFLLWNNMEQERVKEIITFIEYMLENGDEELNNVMAVSVFPPFIYNEIVLERAWKFMGQNTKNIIKIIIESGE
jgi:hypothetical protein